MQEFHLETIGPIGDCAVLQVTGEVDVYTAPMLRERIRDLAAKGVVHLIADLSRVDFLDSTGLGVLVGGLKRLREHGGSLALVISTPRILRIFQITGLTKVFAATALSGRRDHRRPPLAADRRKRSRKRRRMVPAARPLVKPPHRTTPARQPTSHEPGPDRPQSGPPTPTHRQEPPDQPDRHGSRRRRHQAETVPKAAMRTSPGPNADHAA